MNAHNRLWKNPLLFALELLLLLFQIWLVRKKSLLHLESPLLALVSGATGGIRAAREEAVAVVELVLHTLLDKEDQYGRESRFEPDMVDYPGRWLAHLAASPFACLSLSNSCINV